MHYNDLTALTEASTPNQSPRNIVVMYPGIHTAVAQCLQAAHVCKGQAAWQHLLGFSVPGVFTYPGSQSNPSPASAAQPISQ